MTGILDSLYSVTWPERVDSDIAETCMIAAKEIERLRQRGEGCLRELLDSKNQTEDLRAEIERLQAALVQVRGFAHVMSERNWRDLQTHIERQCDALGDLHQQRRIEK